MVPRLWPFSHASATYLNPVWRQNSRPSGPVRPGRTEEIPGVMHRDGTCRIQTVAADEGLESFRELLMSFDSFTGVPALLNTSLNSAGEPIYEAEIKARRLLAFGRLDAWRIGDNVLLKS